MWLASRFKWYSFSLGYTDLIDGISNNSLNAWTIGDSIILLTSSTVDSRSFELLAAAMKPSKMLAELFSLISAEISNSLLYDWNYFMCIYLRDLNFYFYSFSRTLGNFKDIFATFFYPLLNVLVIKLGTIKNLCLYLYYWKFLTFKVSKTGFRSIILI